MSGKQTTYQSILLIRDTTRLDNRQIELTICDDGLILETDANYMYDYESMALNKEQALQLANSILEFYNNQKEVV